MPRLKNSTPKYRLHKATGQAIVTLDGQDFYLGPHGSRPSRREYERLVGEWLQNGRSLPTEPHAITVAQLINAYRKHAEDYYVKDGRSTGTAENMRPVMRLLRRLYGDSPVRDFGPLALKMVRRRMVEAGQARSYVNENVDRIRRMFKWAAGNELIPFEVYQRLTAVDGLRKGRTEAHENAPITPIADEVVEPDVATPNLHFSSHRKMWRGIGVARRFFE
ncbi:MAG: recombinase XerD, partial [Planctomycetota bacterium]|nr:recombinase XerD [Planctomycetota bacterium]